VQISESQFGDDLALYDVNRAMFESEGWKSVLFDCQYP